MYIKGKSESRIILDTNNLTNKIKSCKICANIKARDKETIINRLISLKDEDINNICQEYSYEYTNKENEKNSSIIVHYNK